MTWHDPPPRMMGALCAVQDPRNEGAHHFCPSLFHFAWTSFFTVHTGTYLVVARAEAARVCSPIASSVNKEPSNNGPRGMTTIPSVRPYTPTHSGLRLFPSRVRHYPSVIRTRRCPSGCGASTCSIKHHAHRYLSSGLRRSGRIVPSGNSSALNRVRPSCWTSCVLVGTHERPSDSWLNCVGPL